MTINWDDFEKIDIRVGTITEVNDFPKVRGVYTDKKEVVLLAPDRPVQNGWKIG